MVKESIKLKESFQAWLARRKREQGLAQAVLSQGGELLTQTGYNQEVEGTLGGSPEPV